MGFLRRAACAVNCRSLVLFVAISVAAMLSKARAAEGNEVLHHPVSLIPEDEPIVIETEFTTMVDKVYLNYRLPGDPAFRSLEMFLQSNGKYAVRLSTVRLTKGQSFEYYIAASTMEGAVITYPASDAELMPVQVVIAEKKAVQEAGIEAIVLSPEPNQAIGKEDFMIAVSLFSDNPIDVTKLRLMLDGDDITKKSDVTEELITYSVKNLAAGPHMARVWYAVSKEEIYKLVEWAFEITPEPTEDIFAGKGFTGVAAAAKVGEEARFQDGKFRANFRSEYKSQNNIGLTTNYGRVGADLSYEKNWWQLSGTFDFDSQDDPHKNQPLNRYSVNANVDGVLLMSYGDTYPVFGPLTLYGTRVRGFSGGVYLGIFNLEFVQGELERKVISKSNGSIRDSVNDVYRAAKNAGQSPDSVIIAALNGGTLSTYSGNFKRNILGARFSVGPQNLQWGLAFTKVKDDQGSLGYNSAKSVAFTGEKPQENLVVGTDFKMQLFQKRLQFDASVATSFTNTDITGGTLDESVFEQAGFTGLTQDDIDQFSDFITVNTNLTPIPLEGISDNNLYAYTIGGAFNMYNNNLTTRYRHHGGYFQSFATSIQRDIESFEIADRVRFWQNRAFLTVSYATSTNNLSNRNTNSLDTRNLGFQLALFLPNQLPTVTFAFNTINRDNNFTTDTMSQKFTDQVDGNARPEENTTNVFSVNSSYLFFLGTYRNTATISYTSSIRDDKTSLLTYGGSVYHAGPADADNNMVGLSLTTEWKIPLRTTINFAYSGGTTEFADTANVIQKGKSTTSSYGVGADYILLNKKDTRMSIYGGVALSSVDIPNTDKLSLVSFNLGQRLNLLKKHSFYLNFNLTSGLKVPEYDASGNVTGEKSEVNRIFTGRYEYTF